MEKHPLIRANLSSSVKQYLYKYIRSADLNGNRKLPPENVISENLGVSRVDTVRRALDELEKEGMVGGCMGGELLSILRPHRSR